MYSETRRDLPTRQVTAVKTPLPSDKLADSGVTTYEIESITEERKRRFRWINWELAIILLILVIAGVLHGYNMFHYPYIEDDEGIYSSEAWSVMMHGQLSPYTYWYDHAPAGWIFMALWMLVTGGTAIFGQVIISARIFMLVLQLASVLMVYRITRNLTGSIFAAVIGSLLFAVSPFGIYYHRRILLDNIATFWMLVSITILVGTRSLTLRRVWLSAIACGLAVLSKENAVFIIPALPLLVLIRSHKLHRGLAFFGWTVVSVSVVSLYFLFAILKSELFAPGTLPWDTSSHVSLLGTLQFQASRGKDGGLLDLNSAFWKSVNFWVRGDRFDNLPDPLLTVGGTACAIISLLFFRTNQIISIIGLGTILMWVFLARGGIVGNFYLLPILPLLAICIAMVIGVIYNRIGIFFAKRNVSPSVRGVLAGSVCLILLAGMVVGTYSLTPDHGTLLPQRYVRLLTSPQADAQYEALNWAFAHIPPGSVIVTDTYAYMDLITANRGYKVYWYNKPDLDPQIKAEIGNWNHIDYLIVTDQVLFDMQTAHLTMLADAYTHSKQDARFLTDGWQVTIRQVVHTTAATGSAVAAPPNEAGLVALRQPIWRKV